MFEIVNTAYLYELVTLQAFTKYAGAASSVMDNSVQMVAYMARVILPSRDIHLAGRCNSYIVLKLQVEGWVDLCTELIVSAGSLLCTLYDNQTVELVNTVFTQPSLPSTDATVSLRTVDTVSEGGMFNVTVELATAGTLACDLVVTLFAIPGTATGKKQSIYCCHTDKSY